MRVMRLFFPNYNISKQKFPLLHVGCREKKGTCFHNTGIKLKNNSPLLQLQGILLSWQNTGMIFYLRPTWFLKWSLEGQGRWENLGLCLSCFFQVDMLISQYNYQFNFNVDFHVDVCNSSLKIIWNGD